MAAEPDNDQITFDLDARVPDWELALQYLMFQPLWRLVDPYFEGLDNLPDEPVLFVGNHTLFATFDVPFLWFHIWRNTGRYVRPLADFLNFDLPFWSRTLSRFGAVPGTRPNCAALMDNGWDILVFPGGAREAMKRQGEQHKLIWKKRLGFAKMAIEHEYTIQPFSAVGVDDQWDIVMDGQQIADSKLGKLLDAAGLLPREDAIPPLVRGIAGTPLPRPNRLYFKLGKPIRTDTYGRDPSDENAWKLRRRTARAVNKGIKELLEYRETDPKRSVAPRLVQMVTGTVTDDQPGVDQ